MNETDIPKGWKKVKLKEVLKEVNERNEGEKVKRVLSVTNSRGFVSQEEYFEGTVHSANISNYKVVRKNQFAYNPSRVNVGSIDILKAYEYGALSPMYIVFEVDTTKLLPDYFKYYFQTNKFFENVKNNTQGSVRNSLSFKALADFDYLLPPIEEQEKIVRIMKKVSEIIKNLDGFIRKNEKSKREIFNKIYFNKSKTGWNISKLDELGKFYKGNSISKSDISSKGKKCILYGELYTKYAEVAYEIYSKTNIILENPIYSKKWDVLIPSSGETDVDISTATCVLEDGILLGGDLNIFRPYLEKVNGEFLSYVINYAQKFEIAKYAQGVSIVHLYSEHLKKLVIEYPSIEEQLKIINVLNKINKENELLTQKKHAYENLRKGLMQKLLTGKVRVKI